jgi:hypothetical protein
MTVSDHNGQVYGRLTVLSRVANNVRGHAMWLCSCSCGSKKIIIIRGDHLKAGTTRSCGCLRTEAALRAAHNSHYLKHGATIQGKSWPEYNSYHHAKHRCENLNHKNYKDYGGRGIKFLYSSFEEFFADLGHKPDINFTLERINNFGNYESGNCRWATRLEQANNKRNNRLLTAFGRTQTLSRWAKEYAINISTLYVRLDHGLNRAYPVAAHKR